ncbi:MAG TPA: hypothetical protein VIL21_09340 [Solirubrobacterales bacterium]|jgi:hypothetical protein
MNTFRTIKVLALSALALVAISAVSATGAQAGTFTAGAYPATITGSSAAGSHEFITQLGVMKCAPTFDSKMEAEAATLTVVPNYGTSCKLGEKLVHVTNNECDFRWNAGATVEMDVVKGSMEIACPDNKIDFEITSEPVCHLTVPAQNGLGSLLYTNNTEAEDVTLHFGLEGIFYELDNGCPEVGAFANGVYKGTSTLKADAGGAGTSFQVD